MNYYANHRSINPRVDLKSRAIECADGITRVLVMRAWYWEVLDFHIKKNPRFSQQKMTKLCVKLSHDAVKFCDGEFGQAFHEYVTYYLYKCHAYYLQRTRKIANDFWPAHKDQSRLRRIAATKKADSG